MRILLTDAVKNCISVLENAGFEAFCVGGAVRDAIMGLSPSDFDVTTSCLPDEIQRLFPKTVATGIEHGTVTVIIDGTPIEVTAYRTEKGYSDSRHPDEVSFGGSISGDLARRDFTVNAIAYNEKTGIFDPYGGMDDIKRRTLRTVGHPQERFMEDALRIMRLYRFASQLDFSVEEATAEAALLLLPNLKKISTERIFAELCRMLCGKNIKNAASFFAAAPLEFLGLPKSDTAPLFSLPRERSTRFAALLILSGADTKVLDSLKSDKLLKTEVAALMDLFNGSLPQNDFEIKKALYRYGEELVRRALPLIEVLKGIDMSEILSRIDGITARREPYLLRDLELGGEELIAAGYKGAQIGDTLYALLEKVWQEPALNTKDKLRSLITKQ